MSTSRENNQNTDGPTGNQNTDGHTFVVGQIPVHTVVLIRGSTAAMHAEKPPKFTGVDFKRWKSKMTFYITTLGLSKLLTEEPMIVEDDDPNEEKRFAFEAWGQSDYIARHTILNGLSNELYNVYNNYSFTKTLWEALTKKYMAEEAGMKKFVVGKFLDYKMTDSKTVISQIQEYQLILHELQSDGMIFSE